jgi:hypothetical protein
MARRAGRGKGDTSSMVTDPKHRPSTAEAEERLQHLRAHGPTCWAFTLRTHFPPPGEYDSEQPLQGADEWLCPT